MGDGAAARGTGDGGGGEATAEEGCRCLCDECARKASMLQGLEIAAKLLPPGAPCGPLEELRADLAQHARRAALGRRGGADGTAFLAASSARPWLDYEPDALLPRPLDAFLLGGGCPRVPWAAAAGVAEPAQDVSVCYLVGCGRSGTTVFAELLSRHPSTVFLNEPRQLWIPEVPSMDVWSVAAPARGGRLDVSLAGPGDAAALGGGEAEGGADAAAAAVAESVATGYRALVTLRGGQRGQGEAPSDALVVLEKFPEHAFRQPFLAATCDKGLGPGRCRFMHLVRSGVEVARSIARFGEAGAWYGTKDEWKWKQLAGMLEGEGLSAEFRRSLAAPSTRPFARGLAEWALSVRAARRDRAMLRGAPWLELRYESLLADPEAVLLAAQHHLGLEPQAPVAASAVETLAHRPAGALTPKEMSVLRSLEGSFIGALLAELSPEHWAAAIGDAA